MSNEDERDAQGRMDDEEVCRRLGVEGSAADLPAEPVGAISGSGVYWNTAKLPLAVGTKLYARPVADLPAPEPLTDEIERAYGAAMNAVGHVAAANYRERAREARQWVRDAFDKLRALSAHPTESDSESPLREALAELVEVARRVPSFADDDGLDEAIEKADRALGKPA